MIVQNLMSAMDTEIRTNREKNHALQHSQNFEVCVQDGRSAAQKPMEGVTSNFAGRRSISFRNREALQKRASIERDRCVYLVEYC